MQCAGRVVTRSAVREGGGRVVTVSVWLVAAGSLVAVLLLGRFSSPPVITTPMLTVSRPVGARRVLVSGV